MCNQSHNKIHRESKVLTQFSVSTEHNIKNNCYVGIKDQDQFIKPKM